MSAGAAAEWIVLKFGGTSVSSRANWLNIAEVVRARRASGARVLIVHSALSGVTDRLEQLLDRRDTRRARAAARRPRGAPSRSSPLSCRSR